MQETERTKWRTEGSKVLKVATHAGIFFEEELKRLVAVVRLGGGDEESLEDAVGADPDVGDDAFCLSELVHRERHLLRWSLGRRATGRRRRRRRSGGRDRWWWCLLTLLHLRSFSSSTSQQRRVGSFSVSTFVHLLLGLMGLMGATIYYSLESM